MNTARFIKDLHNFTGEAKLYKVDPPMAYEEYDDNDELVEYSTKYIAVSATVAMFSGSETFIFPSDKDGKVLNWMELRGSSRGHLSHERALNDAGYTVKD